jgi:hypothetical protein
MQDPQESQGAVSPLVEGHLIRECELVRAVGNRTTSKLPWRSVGSKLS